jgi:hypothetical protein
MIMKKTLIAFLIFVCFGTPCFGMEAASLFSIESTEWDLGEGFSIGFYQSSMYFCDATCCKHFSGAYEKVSFRGARCISTGSCAAVSGLVFPLWGIGVMPTCVDNICESGLIVKTSDSFGVVPLDAGIFSKTIRNERRSDSDNGSSLLDDAQ